ncbi:MAG: OmcA/MtrC family decaheme c-type cytochrome [Dehalococcoidales bacterium]|nr:OmcA/MtrC family decaheme c-type cytochrome [Dehalococcoidales bacterium]
MTNTKKLTFMLLLGLSLGLLLLSACQGPTGPTGPQGPEGSPAPIPPGVGLKSTITKVEIGADRKPIVTFTLTDEKGTPLKISDLDGYPSFTLAYIKEDPTSKLTQYVSYTVGDVKGASYTFKGAEIQPVLAEVIGRPGFDPRATTPAFPADHPAFNDLGNGTFTYIFSTVLPGDYDRNATHRVGGQFTSGSRAFVANPTLDFVPAGGAVSLTRQVVTKESCNQCHDPLSAHGGSRQDPALCVTCHTSQNIDPETGNTPEFKVMVHKIHRGINLPSVKAGEDYRIVGFRQTVFDFSKVVFPQFGGSSIGDVRNCITCHGAPPVGMTAEDYARLAPNADNYKNNPSIAACGACHENIDFATGKARYGGMRDHPGGPQANDSACKSCHTADSGKEFDASVVGAHTIPAESNQLKGLDVEIIRVTGTSPGLQPQVVFTMKDKTGKTVLPGELTSIAFNLKGPTTDYLGPATTEAADLTKVVSNGEGTYAYTLATAIPSDATGTWAIGMEVRRMDTTIIGNEGAPINVSERSYNPVAYIPVTDKIAIPRRQIVATEKCNVCHKEIAFHGGGRKNTAEYCQFCHNPANVDVPDRVPERFGGPYDVPPQSINFRLMIHRIHTGEELTRDFTIYRTRGVYNFNEVEFPGDLRNCAKCHVGTSYLLPLPETNANTLAPREFYSPLGPAASACLGCHDSQSAAAHASTMTSVFGEACAACHGQGRDFAVEKVHQR